MATSISGMAIPENLTGKEFDYWYEAQNAKRAVVEEKHYWKFMCFCTAMGFFGLGLFVSNLLLSAGV